ncbi:hypothetical protein [Streptomyces iconiensis]|uniref:Uncharacterized protein n=1 Tax=Streptomyces iconiensis TaxID=1384038 RepID=A0ABT6ZQ10_9ACTN|nr:hypothetical protein [Streptomyces iconiensis]MDJ1131136.1 hypothetical protein [Streptomyces iconiensis]
MSDLVESPLPSGEFSEITPIESTENAGLPEQQGAERHTAVPEHAEQSAGAAAYQLVRGRYRSGGSGFQLELRVDVDGNRPLRKLSGDFFTTTGGTTSYFGSFVVRSLTYVRTATHAVIRGQATFTWDAAYPFVEVAIPLRTVVQPQAPAAVTFYRTATERGASYLCAFVSSYFRTIQWEQDSVRGKVPFVSYNTGSLPQPPSSPARLLTVPRAFAESGIELLTTGAVNTLADSSNGWTDGELHGAMATNFSQFKNLPQWKVWLLVASRYESMAGVRGIMFDHKDAFQRQGCAVFYDNIQGATAAAQRAQLRTYVHELGHAFNLMHSWQKNLASPPAPLGQNQGFGDLSWMNYPQNYNPGGGAPSGETAYWAKFPFQFTANELLHLRHGFYKNVVMGANSFGTGAGDIDAEQFDEPMTDQSGLRLELRGKRAYEFGEPLVVEFKLATTDLRGMDTHAYLHPNNDLVSVAIRQPSGRTLVHRPLLRRCVDGERTIRLDGGRPALYSSAYLGYGQEGHYFQQPGTYELRAMYLATDGSRVVSPTLRVTVRHPMSRADEQVAELMMGEEQGTLFALLGSDSPSLKAGNDALQQIIEQHGKHPFAVYARMVRGLNAEHEFKSLLPGKEGLAVRPVDTKESIQQLSPVVEASVQGSGVDSITLNMVMRRLARAEAKQGDLEQATSVLDRMAAHFGAQGLNQHVVESIRDQAEAEKAALAAEYRA